MAPRFTKRVPALFAVLLLAFSHRFATCADAADGIFANPLAFADLDTNTFTQWVDGAEKPVVLQDGPQHVLWARGGRIEWGGVNFGSSKNAGARHLRIGWKMALDS